ncbi:MAG: non-heme iron oxygenase ferredoxin subunit [Sulfitobacter sp.]
MAREKTWQDVVALSQLESNWVTRVDLGNRKLAIYDTPSGVFASFALCNHGGADLCDGYFDGHIIECPLHQGAFDVRNGLPVSAPATQPMMTYETRVVEGMVQIKT